MGICNTQQLTVSLEVIACVVKPLVTSLFVQHSLPRHPREPPPLTNGETRKYEEMFVSINIADVDLFGRTHMIPKPVTAISSQWGVRCKLPTQIVVQLAYLVTDGCQ